MFENSTINLGALCNSWAKVACCSSELIFAFLDVDSCIQNASEKFVSYIRRSFVNVALHPTPRNKSLTELGVGVQQLSLGNYSHIYVNFFLSQ
jgi:hypothetical protein